MGCISVGRANAVTADQLYYGTQMCGLMATGAYGVKFKYDVRVTTNGGISASAVDWVSRNVHNKWGWYFSEPNGMIGYLTFTDRKDATLVALRYLT